MNQRYRFGSSEVRPSERQLLVDGKPVVLGARAFDLLLCLIEHRDRVVSKSEIMELVWPGLVVEENNLSVQVSALRKVLGAQAISTIPARGYRFSMDVIQACLTDGTGACAAAEDMSAGNAVPAGSVLGMPDKPSIAVLPFHNMSGDPQQEFFADGMCEDIITQLSHVSSLFVIARNSTFAYKGKSPDVRVVARDLGVRYVLEGSVRRAGNRIRVTAQFIDAQTGAHLWAERYDRELEDIFAVQDEVAQGIVGALQSRLLLAEARFASRKRPEAVDAWGHVVQARVKLLAYRHEDVDRAEPFARRAIDIDPDYGEAHSVLGHILAWRSYNRWTPDWYQAAKESVLHCERALALAPSDAVVLTDIGFATWFLGRFNKSVPVLERAASLNSNAAMTCALLGNALSIVGRFEEGIGHIQRAFRLSPKDPLEFMFNAFLASAEFYAGRFDAAKQAADRALQMSPDLIIALLIRAAACVRLNQRDEARALLARVEKLGPSWAVDNLFRPRTDGTLWARYTDALREVMDRAPRL